MIDDIGTIISYLNLLELPMGEQLTKIIIRKSYKSLNKKHNLSVESSGEKDISWFAELKQAKKYLIRNISFVNALIRANFQIDNIKNFDNEHELWKNEEEFKNSVEKAKTIDEIKRIVITRRRIKIVHLRIIIFISVDYLCFFNKFFFGIFLRH